MNDQVQVCAVAFIVMHELIKKKIKRLNVIAAGEFKKCTRTIFTT
jgi:hypothetical protein